MLNHERPLTTTYDSVLLNKIASQICQAIIIIQQQQPEFLLEKYRKVQWQNQANQSALNAKFVELLSQTRTWEELIKKLQLYLKAILATEALNLPIISELIFKIRQQNPLQAELNSSLIPPFMPSLVTLGITVLLLDAENLQLSTNTEKFLTTICNFPLQVKIAFANWSNRGKLDVELHERGYDLIHVPAGRDNADGKMIAFGASIHELYPNAKEVFVCSSDKVMTNLCNNLQQHGLIVYQVSQHGENINIFNNSTGETTIHSVKPLPEIPSFEQFILQLKKIIKDEQNLTASYWIKLSQISKLYKIKYHLNISHIVSKYLPGKRDRDIFINHPADFVIHQIDDMGELYVTVFEHNQNYQIQPKNIGISKLENNNSKSELLSKITTPLHLEAALKMILEELINESNQNSFDISILASKFKQKYGKTITNQLKQLQISGTFIKFLQSCSYFQVQLQNNKWEVNKFAPCIPSSVLLSGINSVADLEQTLKMILVELTQGSKNIYIDIGLLGIKFNQKSGKPITKQMKELQISGSFLKFLQSCSSFQIQQKGNKFQVSLS
ncbi:NYN domain-containing protein [Anabaena sp. UHCC 0451]|uniref:NYN domain-containing protein n=1 Tax=Anabaena sp. UHCC 0451 TaxID=2055235 RepID=UPI002B1F8CA1|nr:NYN domain-containing protein [Anabaena sp. UHCC 0451]MEA5578422.1 NYN domain-containing protein [Anabaena sp. UHCC 0451]